MKPEAKVSQLIRAGAAIQVRPPNSHDTTTLLLAAARFEADPKRLVWCAIYPEDQHHVHHTEYERATVWYDRDVGFYVGKDLVAYVCPIVEQFDIDHGVANNSLARWRAALALPHNQKEFDLFFNEN